MRTRLVECDWPREEVGDRIGEVVEALADEQRRVVGGGARGPPHRSTQAKWCHVFSTGISTVKSR
jgi:hypothetical protein